MFKSFKKMLVATKKENDVILGFMTYGEDVGNLEKRKSTMKYWIDDDSEDNFKTYNNIPRMGFKIDGYAGRIITDKEWIRIYDPYGFYLKITVENLITLIVNNTIINGIIQNECVWIRNEHGNNWLTTIDSVDYINAVAIDKTPDKKITDLKYGYVYSTEKNQKDKFIFLGKYINTLLFCELNDEEELNDFGYISKKSHTYSICYGKYLNYDKLKVIFEKHIFYINNCFLPRYNTHDAYTTDYGKQLIRYINVAISNMEH